MITVRVQATSAEEMQARLGQVIDDLRAGRISPAEAREVTADLEVVAATMPSAKVVRRVGSP